VQRLTAFVRLARLKFLAGSLVGSALGAAVAAYERATPAWAALLAAVAALLAFHLMTHYANDYFDRECDARAVRTPFSGGSGVLVDGSLPPGAALQTALVCAALGLAGAVALAVLGRPLAAALALAIGALAWAYSAPPLRLLARGLGEIEGALVVAILAPLCAYASQTNALSPLALAATLPGAAAMFAMMLAVEYPDLEADRAGGKRNLLVRFGTSRMRLVVYAACLAIYLGVTLALMAGAPPALALMEVLTLPLAWHFARSAAAHCEELTDMAAIAGRGVSLFFVVSLFAALGFIAGLPLA